MKLYVIFVTGIVLALTGCNYKKADVSNTSESVNGKNSVANSVVIADEKVFITQMIAHHQEAVEASQIIVEQTTNEELKNFAEGVIEAQTIEVDQLKQWLTEWYNEEYVAPADYMSMMGDLSQATGIDLDKAYVEGMVMHHRGAVKMANQVLELQPHDELAEMAQEIIDVQANEVSLLESWLVSKYGVEIQQNNDVNHVEDAPVRM